MKIIRIYLSWLRWLNRYWTAYGRSRAVLSSPYFHMAVVVNVLMYDKWLKGTWWTDVLSSLPNLIGFTLSGYAILVSFGSDEFREKLLGESKKGVASPFIRINSTFVHFLFVQVVAVVLAVIASSRPLTTFILPALGETPNPYVVIELQIAAVIFRFVGNLLFVYAWLLALAATMAVFRLSWLYDNDVSRRKKRRLLKRNAAQQDGSVPPE